MIMVDIETLGTRPGSVILSVGAVKFDKRKTKETFYRAVDVLDSLFLGLTTDPDTIKWWSEQSPEAKGALKPTHLLKNVLTDFGTFVKGYDEIWAKGPDFDLVMLKAAYDKLGLKLPWSFRDARDVRTVLALAPVELKAEGVKHTALDDAVFQAKQVIKSLRRL
jgi:hypothetical protein